MVLYFLFSTFQQKFHFLFHQKNKLINTLVHSLKPFCYKEKTHFFTPYPQFHLTYY